MMIRFDAVTKQFATGIIALDSITFDIDAGEFVFVCGPSGSGKTTLMRLLIRELLPTQGKIFLNQEDITTLKNSAIPKLRRQIGVAFQDFKLLPDLTAFENMALSLDVLGKSNSEIKQRVSQILELVGLADKANLFPSQLSGGELQRTVIGRALATEPSLIFADEPTGNLDQATAWQITKLLKDINQLGTTVIMATHNLDIVSSFNDRSIELSKGRIIGDTRSKTTSRPIKAKAKKK